MAEIFTDKYDVIDFQDDGHLGKIHDAPSSSINHFGLFVFDLGTDNIDYLLFRLNLTCKSVSNTVPVGEPLFNIVPGYFEHFELLPTVGLLDKAALELCGWVPIEVPDGSAGAMKPLEKVIVSQDDFQKLTIDIVFNYNQQYIGFLLVPYMTNDGTGKHFEIEFYRNYDIESVRPLLKVQEKDLSQASSDGSEAFDGMNYLLSPQLLNKTDVGKLFDRFKSHTPVEVSEEGYTVDRTKAIRLKGTDSSVNYSMLIHYINVSDNGKVIEVYGFNGYTERYYYPDSAFSLERQRIKKLNIVTWSGILVEFPWAAMLWYGEIVYFADLEEFGECCRTYFKEHGNDACPVCGNPLGWQLKYSFIDVTRIPHQIYFCSKECMRKFNGNMLIYLRALTTLNSDYLLGIKM